jgi:hypothetical protein
MKVSILIMLVLCIISCRRAEPFDITGKWQSLNAQGGFQITAQHEIDFYKDGLPLWSMAASNPPLKFQVISNDENWLSFRVMDGDELFIKGKMEQVNEQRLRIYLFKHHDILDIADEYHRANDFESYTSIMEGILKQPEIEK